MKELIVLAVAALVLREFPVHGHQPSMPLIVPDEELPTNLNTQPDVASTQLLAFGQRLADKLMRERQDKALVFSPLSIATALQLLAVGARGETYTELAQLLGYRPGPDSYTRVHAAFERMIGQLLQSNANADAPEPDHVVRVANALFVDRGLSLRPDYQTVVQQVYKADAFPVDFRSAAAAQHMINEWARESTRGKIKELITSPLDTNTRMVVGSTLYFNAKWQTTFFEHMTKPRPFWMNGRQNPSVDVEMMALGGKFPFYDAPEHNCRILALPYKDSTSTMFIVLPNNSSREAVQNLHRNLNANVMKEIIGKMRMASSIVFLPKMHLSTSMNLRQELGALGVTRLFSPTADLGLVGGFPSVTDNRMNMFHAQPLQTERLEDVLLFSRFGDDEQSQANTGERSQMRSRRSTYKAESFDGKQKDPLRLKDLVLRKRMMKQSHLNKKSNRHRRHLTSASEALQALEALRNSTGPNPGLFANEIAHKVDLVVNEKGTEGGAATAVFLYKTGTKVVFKAEEPFLFFIRHEASQLPLFYGAVFDPRS